MKKTIHTCLRCLFFSIMLSGVAVGARASHIVGADLYYRWIGTSPTDQTYLVTVVLYGNCSSASAAAFGTLPISAPQVCATDPLAGGPAINLTCTIVPAAPGEPGIEVTPVCPADSLSTQCDDPSSTIPGIKKFLYTATVTLPHTFAMLDIYIHWKRCPRFSGRPRSGHYKSCRSRVDDDAAH